MLSPNEVQQSKAFSQRLAIAPFLGLPHGIFFRCNKNSNPAISSEADLAGRNLARIVAV